MVKVGDPGSKNLKLRTSTEFFPVRGSNISKPHRNYNWHADDMRSNIPVETSHKPWDFLKGRSTHDKNKGYTNLGADLVPDEMFGDKNGQLDIDPTKQVNIPALLMGDTKNFTLFRHKPGDKLPKQHADDKFYNITHLVNPHKTNKRTRYNQSYSRPNEPIKLNSKLV